VSKAPRRILIPVLALAALVLTIAGVASSAPAVCGACHAMKPYAQALESTAHKDVTCYKCHLQAGAWDWPAFKILEFARMYPRAGASALTGPASRIAPAPCLKCHAEVLDGAVVSNGIRIKHRFCAPNASCDGCHTASMHGTAIRWIRQSSMDECVACHVERTVVRECNTCHAARTKTGRLAKGPWQITHRTDWKNTHGMGDLRYCRTCHPASYCVPCHKTILPHDTDFAESHAVDALRKDNACLKCHDRATLCDPCHVSSGQPRLLDSTPGATPSTSTGGSQ
jgi:hypothetical protein